MRAYSRSLLLLIALLIADAAWAQEHRPGRLGVELQDLTKEEVDRLGWEAPRGAKVTKVLEAGPAAAAGIEPGDVIATLDGVEVENQMRLSAALIAKGAGATVKLRLIRAGKEKAVSATLDVRPGGLMAGAEKAPQLMLDTGGHTSKIRGLAFTPDGRQIVSGSQDKVVRVWDVDTGKTVRFIRGETAPGSWGIIYAMALSPDGRWLAVGGFLRDESDPATASAVRLYDFASGKLEALLKGHSNVVWALAFSPDSRRLISGSLDKTAIVWDLTARRQELGLSGHAEIVKAVAFTNDGERVVTGSEDGKLRLWSATDGKLIAEMTEHRRQVERAAAERSAREKKEYKPLPVGVTTVAASPTEALLASGDTSGTVLLWDGRTGAFLREFANPGGMIGSADIDSLTFSADGRWLLYTATARGCLVAEVATGREFHGGELREPIKLGNAGYFDNRVSCNGGVAFNPDGRLAAGGHNSAIHVFDPRTRRNVRTLESTGMGVRSVAFADDGRSILWGNDPAALDPNSNKSRFSLTHRHRLPLDGGLLGPPAPVQPAITKSYGANRVTTQHGAFSAQFKPGPRPNTVHTSVLQISKDGKLHAEIDLGSANSGDAPIPFTPDGQTIVVGRDSGIDAYGLDGHLIGEFLGHYGQVRDLAFSPDGRFLVSGGSDQTVRLWNLKTRELIVSLFSGSDGEWVMWTPQGYYTGSPGADKIVGWQINKGPEQAADYVGAEQLRQHLHRPDIVEKAIILASAEQAIREAPGTSFKLADLLARPVPHFSIVAPLGGSTQRSGRASVKIAVEATPDPIKLVRVQVNGRQVEEQTPDIGSGGFGAGEREFDVPLANGHNELRITLTNAIGEKAETLTLTHDGEGHLDKRGTLHILSIGVDEYKGLGNACGGAGCDLKYSVADARKLAEAVEKRLGPSHARIVKRLLVNGGDLKDAPTAGNIIDAVELLRQAEETDTVVLFIAGHGKNEGPDYRFLPTNAELAGVALRGSTVVPWQVLQSAVEAAKGRRLLFVDTCHSGNAYNQRLGNAAYHANIIAYTAARFDQEALENASLGHGLFTYAVVEGLEGKGSLGGKRQISTRELAGYVVKRVGELAKALNGEQEPQYFKGRDAHDYVLADW